MGNESSTLSKRDALQSLLAHGDVLLQLDPRVDGVDVPTDLEQKPLLVLRIGLDMPVPIPDLAITEQGVSATLSFNQHPYLVTLPWQAVFGMVSESGQGLLWTGDVPAEVLERMVKLSTTEGNASGAPEDDPASGPRLTALDGGRQGPPIAQLTSDQGDSPSHLRLLK